MTDDHLDKLHREHAKEDLIDAIKSTFGMEPPAIRQTLAALSHPYVIDQTVAYFAALTAHKCLNYEAPWNCAREAEARYMNIKYGWTGGAGGIGFDESWCEPCRNKVMNND